MSACTHKFIEVVHSEAVEHHRDLCCPCQPFARCFTCSETIAKADAVEMDPLCRTHSIPTRTYEAEAA